VGKGFFGWGVPFGIVNSKDKVWGKKCFDKVSVRKEKKKKKINEDKVLKTKKRGSICFSSRNIFSYKRGALGSLPSPNKTRGWGSIEFLGKGEKK